MPGYVRDNWHLVPEDTRTKYADEGDQAHAVSEAVIQELPVPGYATPEMLKHARDYAAFCRGTVDLFDGKWWVEQKLPLWYMPERNARIDFYALNPWGLHVIDFKYGEGIKVSAEGNKQLAIYARSVVDKLMKEGIKLSLDFLIHLHIYQPRNGGVSTSSCTLQALMDYTHAIERVAHDIRNAKPARFAPSEDTCRWCAAKGFCEARTAWVLRDLPELEPAELVKTTDLALTKASSLTDAQLAAIYLHGNTIKKWVDDVKEYAQHHADQGNLLPGLKNVEGPGRRFWIDPDKAGRLLLNKLTRDEVYPAKMMSPAQAEEALASHELSTKFTNIFESLIGRNEGKPTLAPLDDKRPELGTKFLSALRDLPDGEFDL